MNERPLTVELPFHVHLFCLYGPVKNPTVRVLLIDANSAETIYEGFGSWAECRGWIKQLSSTDVSTEELAALRNMLGRKRLATIKEVRVSLYDLESLGFHRADS